MSIIEYPEKDTLKRGINQFSIFSALWVGAFEGFIKCTDLIKFGDTGLGGFDGIAGEMIVVDGIVYKPSPGGKVEISKDSDTTPYSIVSFLDDPHVIDHLEGANLDDTRVQLENDHFTNCNIFYVVRMDGHVDYVNTRTGPKMEKPYPNLAKTVEYHVTCEMEDVDGTFVGFWMPAYVKGFNISGIHLHFITKDRTLGGHMVDFKNFSGTVKWQEKFCYNIQFPQYPEYSALNLETGASPEAQNILRI